MDVVVRTPHGEADIVLSVGSPGITFGDVVTAVVGHPSPPVVFVDGRAVASTTAWLDGGVAHGSVIATEEPTAANDEPTPVAIAQIAGLGGGNSADLLSGNYRIGPGRRVHADELAMAPVDDAVMELRVADDGAVRIRGRQGAHLVGVGPLDEERFVPWDDRALVADGRVFELRRTGRDEVLADAASAGSADGRRITPDGTITFHRPPRASLSVERWASAPNPCDVAAMAASRSEHLWQRRIDDSDALEIPIGLQLPARASTSDSTADDDARDGRLETVVADLRTGRGLGIVGRADFTRRAAASAMLTAAVLHGPVDLDIVVLTTGDRVDRWEWVKWLPHCRTDDRARVVTDAHLVRSWLEPLDDATAASRHTIVLVDDDEAWHRDSPLRRVTDTAMPLRFIVLTEHLHDVPTLCDTVLSERSQGTVHVEWRTRRRRFDDVAPFLVSSAFAADVARRLAPLDDALHAPDDHGAESVAPTIADVHGLGPDVRQQLTRRWSPDHPTIGLPLRFGTADERTIGADLAVDGPHLVVRGTTDAIALPLLGAAIDRPPAELEVVVLSVGEPDAVIARLPHTSVALGHLDTRRARRALRSLGAERRRRRARLDRHGVADIDELNAAGAGPAMRRLVVLVDDLGQLDRSPDAPTATSSPLVRSLLDLGDDGAALGMHIVQATRDLDDTSGLAEIADIIVDVDDTGSPSVLRIGHDDPQRFQPARPAPEAPVSGRPHAAPLTIAPFVVARDLSPMEKRLDEATEPVATIGADVQHVVDAMWAAEAVGGHDTPRRPAVAPELPDHVDVVDLLDTHPGDGVPYAVVDDPDSQGHQIAFWLPGASCTIAAYGVARSLASSLVPSLAFGAATRTAADDLELHVISDDTAQLGALAELPHVATTAALAARSRFESLVQRLSDEVDRRAAAAVGERGAAQVAATHPTVVVMIDDVGGCRRHLEAAADDLWDRFEQVLQRGQRLGVCAVLVARRCDEISPALASTIDTHLVLQLAANDDASALGISQDDRAPAIARRAVRAADGADLQLAAPPPSLLAAIQTHLALDNVDEGTSRR